MKLLQILVKLIIFLNFLFFTTASDVSWYADTNKPARLECKHSLSKADIITWHKNNTQIVFKSSTEAKISEGFNLEQADGKVYLIINKVKKVDRGNYSCSVFNRDQPNDYKTISGYLQVRAVLGCSHPIRSSLSALLVGCLLQVVLHGL